MRGIPEIMFCRILMFMWSFVALFTTVSRSRCRHRFFSAPHGEGHAASSLQPVAGLVAPRRGLTNAMQPCWQIFHASLRDILPQNKMAWHLGRTMLKVSNNSCDTAPAPSSPDWAGCLQQPGAEPLSLQDSFTVTMPHRRGTGRRIDSMAMVPKCIMTCQVWNLRRLLRVAREPNCLCS